MANKDAAFGFRPVSHLSGGTIRTREYSIAANYGQNIFRGQPVLAVTAGGIERATDSSGTVGLIVGVFSGCFYTDPTTSKPTFAKYYPASTNASDIVAYVWDDPQIVFEVQHDGTGTAAMNFGGFDAVGLSGSTATGNSTAELDTTSVTTSGNWVQIGISKDPENSDTSSANCNAYVIPNVGEHSYLLAATLG
jgi:hypothetical protein